MAPGGSELKPWALQAVGDPLKSDPPGGLRTQIAIYCSPQWGLGVLAVSWVQLKSGMAS